MKVRYEFVTGEKPEFDVSEELGAEIAAMEKSENRHERAETRRHQSLNGMDYEGEIFADDTDIVGEALINLDLARPRTSMSNLLPRQKELIYKVFFDRRSISSIADEEGVDEKAIRKRLKKIYAHLKKNLI